MILPFLEGLASVLRAPATWLLIIVNTIVCVATTRTQEQTHALLEHYYEQDDLIKAQGVAFALFIQKDASEYSELFQKISDLAISGHSEQQLALGRLALRDRLFLHAVDEVRLPDSIMQSKWQHEFTRLNAQLRKDPVYRWGLEYSDPGFVKWISYQFLHGGYFHLISNMWFLLIFGSALEPLLGSFLFLFFYLGAGVLAAGSYIWLSGLTAIPLIGASGSVSGLMGLYAGIYWEKRARFLYWLLPIKGYTGFVELPAFVLVLTWGASDLAGYLSTMPEIGGIAHAAHLGGAGVGLAIGLVVRHWCKPATHSILAHTPRL